MPLDATQAARAATMTDHEIEMFLRRSLAEATEKRDRYIPDDLLREIVWDLLIDLRDKGLAVLPRGQEPA